MRRLFQLFLVMMPFAGWTQDVTGVWQGHFRSNNVAMRSSLFDDRYRFEVQIAQTDKNFEAVTYSYLSSIFYGKAAAAGTRNSHTGKVMLQEGKLLEVRNQSGDVCIMTCFLQYSKSGDEEFLEGTYVSMNVRDSSNCGRGTVFLRKVTSSDFYKEPFLVKKEKDNAEKGDVTARTPEATPGKETAKIAMPVKPVVRPRPGGAKTGTKIGALHKDSTLAKAGTPGKNGATTKPTVKTAPPVIKTAPPVTKTAPPVTKTLPPTAKAATPHKSNKTEKPAPTRTPRPIARVIVPTAPVRQPGSDSTGLGRKFPTIIPRLLLTRSNPVVRSLTVHVNEVTLNIYDDGAIDHDTVSVYLDNKQVISHAMLTDRPLTLTLHLDETNDYHELVMVAENEGEIPPNTSLMIVKAGDKEYEVRITSTEQKNAVVTFKYVK